MIRVFVSTYPFGTSNPIPRKLLENTGWQIEFNPYKRKLKPGELAELASNADGIIAGTENLNDLLMSNSKLQFISRVGIGLDSVPLQLCKDRGIKVSYTPDAVTPAVAELTIGLMLALTRYVANADREIRKDKWTRPIGKRLGLSKIGIIGFGRVGQRVIRLLSSFQPEEILVNDKKEISTQVQVLRNELTLKITETTKEDIYRVADIVSLHVPFYPSTKNMISKGSLQLFRKDAVLINTARGELVQEEDLYEALAANKLAGAALDVFETEPYNGKLRELDNVLLTQHMGSCSFDCRYEMEIQATEEIIRFFQGKPLLREVPDMEYSYQGIS